MRHASKCSNTQVTVVAIKIQTTQKNHFKFQCLLFQLYKNDRLILHNFILLFNSLLSQLHQRLKLYTLEEFSKCLLQIEASCKDAKSALEIFQTYLSNITTMMLEVQSLCQKNIAQTYDDELPVINDVVLISSPLIKIDINSNDDESDLLKRLQLTPVEGRIGIVYKCVGSIMCTICIKILFSYVQVVIFKIRTFETKSRFAWIEVKRKLYGIPN